MSTATGAGCEGEPLFAAGDDWWHNACLNYSSDDWGLYALGYRQAADVLIEHVADRREHLDSLVYPIIFLYRQYLELTLKGIIREGNQFLGEVTPCPAHHELKRLWVEGRRVIEETCRQIREPNPPEEIGRQRLDEVTAIVTSFAETDQFSTAFRYPTDKGGLPSLPGLRHINIRQVYERVARVGETLNVARGVISHYLRLKIEAERGNGE